MSIPQTLKTRLDREHVHYDVLPHSQMFHAADVARALQVPQKKMAKVVIVKANKRFIMAVLPASWNIDLHRLRTVFGTRRIRLATEEEISRLFPDCEVGAMSPLGTLYGLPVYVDRSLTSDEQICFEGGTHSASIRMRYWDFAALVFPVVAEFHRVPAPIW